MSEEYKKMYHRLMYYNDKEHLAKRIIDLQKGINYLKSQLNKKDNIIKEVREYIHWRLDNRQDMYITQMSELLEILGDNDENI